MFRFLKCLDFKKYKKKTEKKKQKEKNSTGKIIKRKKQLSWAGPAHCLGVRRGLPSAQLGI
jgi:hypothetical protein